MIRLGLLLVLLSLGQVSYGQIYKADLVCIKEGESFKTIANVGYLDYNTKGRYVEVAFQDTVYFYRIQQTNRPKDRKRFVVWFKKTDDNMLWNTTDEGNYVFGFIINGTTYWFRDLSNPTKEEYDQYIEALPKKSYD
jgi:hypothetical protein